MRWSPLGTWWLGEEMGMERIGGDGDVERVDVSM